MTYRYVLSRSWRCDLPAVLFVGLNPSTADAHADDATTRRCVGFARDWGFGRLVLANLFAFRATDPSRLLDAGDPVGPANDEWLADLCMTADLIVAAWGTGGSLLGRAGEVLPRLRGVHHLGLTRNGHPRHPLYLPRATRPLPFWKNQPIADGSQAARW